MINKVFRKELQSIFNLRLSKPYLDYEVPASEICDGSRKPGPAPNKAEKKRTFCVGKGFHHLPEPLYERSRRLDPFICGYRFQKVQRDIWTPTHLKNKTSWDKKFKQLFVRTSALLFRFFRANALNST